MESVEKMNSDTYLAHGRPVVDEVGFALEAIGHLCHADVHVLRDLLNCASLILDLSLHL